MYIFFKENVFSFWSYHIDGAQFPVCRYLSQQKIQENWVKFNWSATWYTRSNWSEVSALDNCPEATFGFQIWTHIHARCWCIPMQSSEALFGRPRTLLGDLWNVHNCCETCTTAGKRAQHLWHVHNISETCYLKTLVGGGETMYTHIYIYIHTWLWYFF